MNKCSPWSANQYKNTVRPVLSPLNDNLDHMKCFFKGYKQLISYLLDSPFKFNQIDKLIACPIVAKNKAIIFRLKFLI